MPSWAGQALTRKHLAFLHRVTAARGPALTLAGTAQPAGGVAGHHVALHAEPAHVDTLVELFRVVAAVTLQDAAALLRGIFDLLRTGRQAHREQRQSNQTPPSHGTLSPVRAFARTLALTLASSRPGRELMKHECQILNSTGIEYLDRGPVILTFEEATAEKGRGCQSLATKAACQITNGRRDGSVKISFEMGAQDRGIPSASRTNLLPEWDMVARFAVAGDGCAGAANTNPAPAKPRGMIG